MKRSYSTGICLALATLAVVVGDRAIAEEADKSDRPALGRSRLDLFGDKLPEKAVARLGTVDFSGIFLPALPAGLDKRGAIYYTLDHIYPGLHKPTTEPTAR